MTTASPAAPTAIDPAIAAIAERMRAAHATKTPVRIVGAGTWLDAGHPVRAGLTRLEMTEVRGIVEYVPGDLTLTALAGTTLAELDAATREHGQRLALDPFGGDAGTIGATVATASAGTLSGTFGTPRDVVLGLAVVTGAGEVIRAGGRVVKNVAGFDLVRLNAGAWGTLGAIAEVTVRLRALPAVDTTYAIALEGGDARVPQAVAALRALPFTYDAIELLDPATARKLGIAPGVQGTLLVRAAGTPMLVRAMHEALRVAGAAREVGSDAWATLRTLEPAGSATVRFSHAATRVGDVWLASRRLAERAGGWALLSVGRTVARITVPRAPQETADAFGARVGSALDYAVRGFDGACLAERVPPRSWSAKALQRPPVSATLAQLERRMRAAFDPAHLLNPGILGAAGGEG